MSGKCCGQDYYQFKATSTKNPDGVFVTKRYYVCRKCDTVYVETDTENGVVVDKFPPKSSATLDQWMC